MKNDNQHKERKYRYDFGDCLPCPFCGLIQITLRFKKNKKTKKYVIQCDNCLAQGSPSNSHEELLDNWNKRDGTLLTQDMEQKRKKQIREQMGMG